MPLAFEPLSLLVCKPLENRTCMSSGLEKWDLLHSVRIPSCGGAEGKWPSDSYSVSRGRVYLGPGQL